MLLTSLGLLFAAAIIHASSHALIKGGRDKLAFSWWMLGVSSLLGLPLLAGLRTASAAGLFWVLLSGVLEAVYFSTLSRAYTSGDFSSAYPVARGSAPLFTLLWATLLLGEHPTGPGLAGIFLVVIGIYAVNLPSLSAWKRPLASLRRGGTRWALATGILISAYSAVDKVGIIRFDPVSYLYLVLLVSWLVLAPQWLSSRRRRALIAEIGIAAPSGAETGRRVSLLRRIDWHSCVRIGGASLLGFAAYVLVLAALRRSPVSYVGPIREMSVVISAWIGTRWLGEEGGGLKIVAALIVVAGIALIALAG